MARTKQRRFVELREMPNVVDGLRFEPGWFMKAFEADQEVVLELGCGRGEYTVAMARSCPALGVLGVDKNGARLWRGAAQALEEGLANAVFLRSQVEYLEDHVPPARVNEIWLPFPDPLPKNRQAQHRLVSPHFLGRYRRVLRQGGLIHLRTDDRDLVEFAERATLEVGGRVLDDAERLSHHDDVVTAVHTTYERRYRREGRAIYDRRFCLD